MSEYDSYIKAPSINQKEVENFSRLADQWWDPKGKFRPLHKFNPIRLEFITKLIAQQFDLDINKAGPFAGLEVLDIGCGGGLLCEPLTRLGANVTGIDAAKKNIEVAKIHAEQSGLDINYRNISLEELAESETQFDVVLNMEVVEHVENPAEFIRISGKMVKQDGIIFIATLNRTLKSWGLAIIAAEYILRWLPQGTHSYNKFVKPSELLGYFNSSEFELLAKTGIIYKPLYDKWQLSTDMDVNYMVAMHRI